MQRASLHTLLLSCLIPAGALAQPMPQIDLDPAIECWYHSDFPTLTALVDPSEEIVNSRLYFRCSLFQDYYFVDLKIEGGVFTAVAPQAEETCPLVHYYVEAVTRDFMSVRTPERVAEVTSANECRRRHPAAASFLGEDPQILLGSTSAGPALAPGFKSVGVSAFMSATGSVVASSAGAAGGSSAAIIAGVAAGGAAVGVGVLVAGDSDSTTSQPAAIMLSPPPPPPPPPPPVTVPPTSPPAQLKACVRFDPINAIVDVNERLVVDGRCSEGGDALTYTYDLGDGRIKEGQAFIVVVYSTPGTYKLQLTVRNAATTFAGARRPDEDTITRTVRVRQDLVADFDAYNVDVESCHAEFDASPSSGDIAQYRWELDINNDFGEGVIRTSGKIVRHRWTAKECFRAEGKMTTRLTVVGPDGVTETVTKQVNVFGERLPEATIAPALETSLTTQFVGLDRSVRVAAQVILADGRSQPVSVGGPSIFRYRGTRGLNAIDGVVMAPLEEPVMWRFDFSQSSHFVPGSLRLVSGTAVSSDGRSIVVRMSGRPGERVRIEYELAR